MLVCVCIAHLRVCVGVMSVRYISRRDSCWCVCVARVCVCMCVIYLLCDTSLDATHGKR